MPRLARAIARLLGVPSPLCVFALQVAFTGHQAPLLLRLARVPADDAEGVVRGRKSSHAVTCSNGKWFPTLSMLLIAPTAQEICSGTLWAYGRKLRHQAV